MDIILLQDVDKLGSKFEIVTVKNGYGRNYLIPQGLGLIANESNRKRLAEVQRREDAHAEKHRDKIEAMRDMLADKVLKIGAKVGSSDKIFGSVTNVQIANALKDQFDIDIDRRKIHLEEEVKILGSYTARLDLHKEIDVKVNFEVISE